MPAVAQILRDGLELPAGLTVLVGENGSGKSTVIEILAEAYGLNPQGGSAMATVPDPGERAGTRLAASSSSAGRRPGPWSYFLRADTMHGLYTYLEENPAAARSASTSSATARASSRCCGPG